MLLDDIGRRRFRGWTLAYSGASVFVDGLIKVLTEGGTPLLGGIQTTCAA